MKLLVCGGRDYRNALRVRQVLDLVDAVLGVDALIHGAARGADNLAAQWAGTRGEAYPADWAAHGRGAGPRRNRAMLKLGRPDAVVAFPGGSGTADMVAVAKRAGVPVWVVQ